MASLLDFINSSARIVGRNVDLLAPRGGGRPTAPTPLATAYIIHVYFIKTQENNYQINSCSFMNIQHMFR